MISCQFTSLNIYINQNQLQGINPYRTTSENRKQLHGSISRYHSIYNHIKKKLHPIYKHLHTLEPILETIFNKFSRKKSSDSTKFNKFHQYWGRNAQILNQFQKKEWTDFKKGWESLHVVVRWKRWDVCSGDKKDMVVILRSGPTEMWHVVNSDEADWQRRGE